MEGVRAINPLTATDRWPWTWGRAAVGVALVLLGVAVTADVWADILRIAVHDEEASQVFLAPVVAAWLIVARWDGIRRARPSNSLLGPGFILAGWILSSVGYHNGVQAFWHGGAVVIAVGCLLSVTGGDLLRRAWPAFGVLVFLVPVPGMLRQQLAIPLQQATASVTHFAFELLAIPVEQSGNVLRFNGVDVAVAEACNGMRMVFVLVLVCYAVAFASPLRPGVRALILIASPICAVACNVVRLIPTVWLYGYYPQSWGPIFHDYSGWAMILVAFLMVMGLIRLLRWIELPVMQEEFRVPSSGFRVKDSESAPT